MTHTSKTDAIYDGEFLIKTNNIFRLCLSKYILRNNSSGRIHLKNKKYAGSYKEYKRPSLITSVEINVVKGKEILFTQKMLYICGVKVKSYKYKNLCLEREDKKYFNRR